LIAFLFVQKKVVRGIIPIDYPA